MSKTRTNSQKLYDIIKKPLVTDKSHQAIENNNQYTFEVAKDATKTEIRQAVELIFPGKKAIVTIAGDPIEELTGV